MNNSINNALQWAGTACFISMYTVMSYFAQLAPLNIVFGIMGSTCYLVWCIRVRNRPQMIVNAVGIAVCIGGLFKHIA